MANYEPIPFSKEAEQIVVPDVDPSDGDVTGQINVDSIDFQIYRDTQGFYTLVPTAIGSVRANPTDWIMKESAIIPAVPATPGVAATGLFVVANAAAGDGIVGFNFNGIVYAVSPGAAVSAADTAQQLVDLVNLGGQLTAVLSVESVVLTAVTIGGSQNIALIDVTTDTTQTGAETGMTGGVTEIPETPEQPAVYSVWNDTEFTSLFQVI